MTARPGQSHASQGPAGVEPRRGGGRAGRGVYGKRSLAGARQRRGGRSSPRSSRAVAEPRSPVRPVQRRRAGASLSLHGPKTTQPGAPKLVDPRVTAANAVALASSCACQLAIRRRTRGIAGQWMILKRVLSPVTFFFLTQDRDSPKPGNSQTQSPWLPTGLLSPRLCLTNTKIHRDLGFGDCLVL